MTKHRQRVVTDRQADAIKGEIAHMVNEWEGTDELAGEFAERLFGFVCFALLREAFDNFVERDGDVKETAPEIARRGRAG